MDHSKTAVSVGLQYPTCYDIKFQMEHLAEEGFDYAVLPLVHRRFSRHKDVDRYKVFGLPEDQLQSLSSLSPQWMNQIVCDMHCSLKNFESSNVLVRNHAKDLINQELDYITYLGIPFVVFSLDQPEFCNFARTLHAFSEKSYNCFKVWIKVPIRPVDTSMYREDEEEIKEDTWKWWNRFRSITNYDSKFELVLEINGDICDDIELSRWLGEPLRGIFLPTHVFQTNRAGNPVLNTALAKFVKIILQRNLQVVLVGVNRHERYLIYVQYMLFLKKTSQSDDPLTSIATNYEDYLQFPLQPLADNLSSFTYEVFEKDPIKYIRYQEAVKQALLDRVPPDQADVVTTIMVVGAGRGPLVTASLDAAKEANRKVRVYAVEKNMSAVVGLKYKKEEQWAKCDVTIISEDMRTWNAPEKADIMVSELLGSFGDNELSPECLYAAQKYLKEDGISIPYNYTSYIAPIMSHKLYSQVKASMIKEYQHPLVRFEQPYVVYQRDKYNIAPPQPCFTFVHPSVEKEPDNSRYTKVTFHTEQDSVLHGIAGYFDMFLYKGINISIHPDTQSPGLISWFPVLFPIHEPIHLKANDEVEVHFWRLCDNAKVWYEWLISKPTPSAIHNLDGRSYKMMKILS